MRSGFSVAGRCSTKQELWSSRDENRMTETGKRRRRWSWMVLAAVLILISGAIAWRLRPLNAAERSLVGLWVPATWSDDLGPALEFRSDRRFTAKPRIQGYIPFSGSWNASASDITMRRDFSAVGTRSLSLYAKIQLHIQRSLFPGSSALQFEDLDHVTLGRTRFRRMADPAPPAQE